jgi:hypothetical protein
MVKRMCDDGIHFWHEPPYTEEEEMALYKMIDGPITMLRAPSNPQNPSRPAQPQKTPQPPQAK